MDRNNSRGTATSAIWKTTFLAWHTTFAPILISFSRNVVNDQCRTALGNTACRRKFPMLYASTNSCSRTWLSTKSWHESRVHLTAFLPSLIHCSAVPRSVVEPNHPFGWPPHIG